MSWYSKNVGEYMTCTIHLCNGMNVSSLQILTLIFREPSVIIYGDEASEDIIQVKCDHRCGALI